MPIVGYRKTVDDWVHFIGLLPETTDRDTLAYGTYKPTASTVGPPAGTTFTTITGPVTHATPNTTITDTIFNGVPTVNAANITYRRCVFRGDGVDKMVKATGSNDFKGARYIDCLFDGTGREGVTVDAINGSNFTLERCEIRRVGDGVGITTAHGPTNILGCWIHDSSVFKWAPGTPGMPGYSDYRTHNDGIQIHVGANTTIRGNYIGGVRKNYSKTDPAQDPSIPDSADDFDNAALLIQQEVDNTAGNKIRNLLIEDNWLHGGAATLNLGYKHGNALNDNVTIRNNRFPRRITPGGGFYIYRSTSTTPTMTGNVYDDDGTATTVNTY